MKILRVVANTKRKELVLQTKGGDYSFPYSLLEIKPTAKNSIVHVSVDKEAACEAVSYELQNGTEGTLHIDQVLEFNEDPEYLREACLYRLTLEAQKLIKTKKLSKRILARRLNTSPTQLYRLLDQTFYGKTIDQMLKLLAVLGKNIEFTLVNKAA